MTIKTLKTIQLEMNVLVTWQYQHPKITIFEITRPDFTRTTKKRKSAIRSIEYTIQKNCNGKIQNKKADENQVWITNQDYLKTTFENVYYFNLIWTLVIKECTIIYFQNSNKKRFDALGRETCMIINTDIQYYYTIKFVFCDNIVLLRDVFHIGLIIGPRTAVLARGAAEHQYSRPRTYN